MAPDLLSSRDYLIPRAPSGISQKTMQAIIKRLQGLLDDAASWLCNRRIRGSGGDYSVVRQDGSSRLLLLDDALDLLGLQDNQQLCGAITSSDWSRAQFL